MDGHGNTYTYYRMAAGKKSIPILFGDPELPELAAEAKTMCSVFRFAGAGQRARSRPRDTHQFVQRQRQAARIVDPVSSVDPRR